MMNDQSMKIKNVKNHLFFSHDDRDDCLRFPFRHGGTPSHHPISGVPPIQDTPIFIFDGPIRGTLKHCEWLPNLDGPAKSESPVDRW